MIFWLADLPTFNIRKYSHNLLYDPLSNTSALAQLFFGDEHVIGYDAGLLKGLVVFCLA